MKNTLLNRILPAIDSFSRWLAYGAMAMTVVMIVVTMQEVIRRKGFNDPTVWANDITYMLNGSLFLIGAGYTLRMNGHVRIDFLSQMLPLRLQHFINLIFYLGILLPGFGLIAWLGATRAISAYDLGRIETMSAWEPLIWPFYTGITIGLFGLFIQSAAEAVRHIVGIADPDAVDGPSVKSKEVTLDVG